MYKNNIFYLLYYYRKVNSLTDVPSFSYLIFIITNMYLFNVLKKKIVSVEIGKKLFSGANSRHFFNIVYIIFSFSCLFSAFFAFFWPFFFLFFCLFEGVENKKKEKRKKGKNPIPVVNN